MSKLAQLREARNAKAKEAHDLNAKHPGNAAMPSADAARLDELLASIEAIDADIAREQRMAQLAGDNPQAEHEAALHAATRDPSRQGAGVAALRAFLRGGVNALAPEQLHAMRARQTPELMAGMSLLPGIQAAMSTTTPAEGGYTVAPEFHRELEVAMKAYGAMLEAGEVMPTSSGADMNFVTGDDTTEIGEIVGQNTQTNNQDTTFGNITLATFMYSSKSIALPWQLLMDSFLDIEAYINAILGRRLGRIYGAHSTVGTGTGQPRGIVVASSVGKQGTTGQTVTVTYDDLVDLEHSVDPSYRSMPGVGFMMHDTSLARLRKIKDAEGRPIFVPGYETGNPGGAPDRLMNRRIFINQDMPVMAANAKSILFGDFKRYKCRQVMDTTLFRMTDSAYTLKAQVGFVAFNRMGGNLIDVGGAVKAYQNSAT